MVAFLAGLLAGKGVFGFDAATWTMVLGSVAGAAAIIWNAVSTRKSALVSQVAVMPEVKTVELAKGVAGVATLDAATPDNVVIK
jgi:hypothetical protein